MTQSFLDGRVILHAGDSRDVLATLPDASIDSVVTDPPYALVSIGKRFGKEGAAPAIAGKTGAYARASAGFMGQQWDTGETAFAVEFWAQVWRVLKPGGHVVAFSGTRTYHRMVCAIEDAGFEIRDQLAWVYGSGFPKSHDVAKGIDKMDAAAERRRRALKFTAWVRSVGLTARSINDATGTVMGSHYVTDKEQPLVATRQHMEMIRPLIPVPVPDWVERLVDDREVESENFKARPVIGQHDEAAHASKWRANYAGGSVPEAGAVTRPFTPEAQAWQGWGTALKPAWEPIVLARKPLEGTVAANVLAHGTGAVNIDGCRVHAEDAQGGSYTIKRFKPGATLNAEGGTWKPEGDGPLYHGETKPGRWPANILHDGSDEVVAAFPSEAGGSGKASGPSLRGANRSVARGQFNGLPDGLEPAFYGDSGSAARFFYSAKADAEDRIGSKHPTVKPVDLMQWLCRLVTPPGGVVLDPFAGTGTTGEAAWREGFRAVLIEREEAYRADIARRMDLALASRATRARESAKAKEVGKPIDLGPLFGPVEAVA